MIPKAERESTTCEAWLSFVCLSNLMVMIGLLEVSDQVEDTSVSLRDAGWQIFLSFPRTRLAVSIHSNAKLNRCWLHIGVESTTQESH